MKIRKRGASGLVDCAEFELSARAREGLFVCKLHHSHATVEGCANRAWRFSGAGETPPDHEVRRMLRDEVPGSEE